MVSIKIGADPEGWLVDGNGDYIPAFGFVPGNKQYPHKLERGAVQVDGMAVEFNIDAAANVEEFTKNISTVTTQIEEMVHSVDKDINISWNPVAKFKKNIWSITPEQCKMLGCDPDFNIEGEVNVNPLTKLENEPIRTAAGHIHIGWLDDLIEDPMSYDHFQTCLEVAREFFHGNISSYVPHTDEEIERMNYYGHSGSFRPKKYGVELRAPSNLWVKSKESQELIFNQTRNKFHDITGL